MREKDHAIFVACFIDCYFFLNKYDSISFRIKMYNVYFQRKKASEVKVYLFMNKTVEKMERILPKFFPSDPPPSLWGPH